MTSPSNQELAAHGGNADWTCQLNELQSQLEQLVEAAGGGSDPNGVNAQACLEAFNHLRAVAPIQLRSHAQTEQALWLANRALEKANADLAASNSLSYQIDMVKVKR